METDRLIRFIPPSEPFKLMTAYEELPDPPFSSKPSQIVNLPDGADPADIPLVDFRPWAVFSYLFMLSNLYDRTEAGENISRIQISSLYDKEQIQNAFDGRGFGLAEYSALLNRAELGYEALFNYTETFHLALTEPRGRA